MRIYLRWRFDDWNNNDNGVVIKRHIISECCVVYVYCSRGISCVLTLSYIIEMMFVECSPIVITGGVSYIRHKFIDKGYHQ
jgi:hypothetical protein